MNGCKSRVEREEGQSIVILAMAMVGLLLFAGLAVDAGVIYVGSVRLARAVDAAALAGVVELPNCDATGSPCYGDPFEERTCLADDRALQFLAANEIWPTAEITGTDFFDSSRQSGVFGTDRYLITATHQVDLYFLPLVNIRYVRLRDSAVAEYNSLVNIYASHRGYYGVEQTVNLAVFGPDICSRYGDPYTPSHSPWWDELQGVYPFRIDIPGDYESTAHSLTEAWNGGADTNEIVRVEIWDPDCYNTPQVSSSSPPNEVLITDTTTIPPTTRLISPACSTSNPNDYIRQNPCTPETGDPQNPFWFIRIDENRQGNPNDDSTCSTPSSYTPGTNTTTRYTLYYYRKRGDGSLERRNLARYTKGGAESDSDTDLRWVCPGGSLPGDPAADAGFVPDVGDGNFEVDLSTEAPDIYVNPVDGSRALFLDVQAIAGASENGFDLWAGPRYINLPDNINDLNIYLIEHEGARDEADIVIYGIGHLPMNSNHDVSSPVTVTLAYVPQEWEGRTMYVDQFDNDSGTTGITFFFDSIPMSDWSYPGTLAGNGQWGTNDFTIPSVPTYTFYGGYLKAAYDAGPHDTFGWKLGAESTPWLVE